MVRPTFLWSLDSFTELARWGDEPVHDLAWLDDDTLAFATDSGLVLARLA